MARQKTQPRKYHTQQIGYLREQVRYTDAGTAVEIGRLMDGSITLLDEMPFGAFVVTAFNGGGTDLLDIGYGAHNDRDGSAVVADPDNMATDLDVSTTGWKPVDEAGGADRYVSADDDGMPITATYADQSSNASAGLAVVVCGFIPPNNDESTT